MLKVTYTADLVSGNWGITSFGDMK